MTKRKQNIKAKNEALLGKEQSDFSKKVKELKELTSFGVFDCINALKESDGDIDKAKEILEAKRSSVAESKLKRETTQGTICSYIHKSKNSPPRQGSLLELRCESDFVAQRADFQALAKDICTHIVLYKPLYISIDDVPKKEWDDYIERSFQRLLLENWREEAGISAEEKNNLLDLAGKEATQYFSSHSLLSQPFIHNETLKVSEHITNYVAIFQENIKITRFERYEL
jgi:elongation factor Ts